MYISSEHFQLGRRRNHACPGQRKFSCPGQKSNSRVRFSPRVRKVSLSRASMVSPPFKLKMFTGSVCVLLTGVSLKLITIKNNKINLRNNEFVRKKQNGG